MLGKKLAVAMLLGSMVLLIVSCSGPAAAQTPAPTQNPGSTPAPVPSTSPKPVPSTSPSPVASPKPSGPIKATWINPQISGDTVSILQDDVVRSWNIHFNYQTSGVNDNFMAYSFDGQLYVRASVCPPCRSKSFSLVGDTLVCDTCGTVFKAKTGAGVSGACVAYPKASVPYRIVDGKILMDKADLLSAYQKTLKPA